MAEERKFVELVPIVVPIIDRLLLKPSSVEGDVARLPLRSVIQKCKFRFNTKTETMIIFIAS